MRKNWKDHAKAQLNLTEVELLAQVILRKEGELAGNGALVVRTGKKTGRSPNDRFFVFDEGTMGSIQWGKLNQPIEALKFDRLYEKISDYLKDKDLFVRDAYACADSKHRFSIQVVNELAWQNLFAGHLFLRYQRGEEPEGEPSITLISAPNFLANPKEDGVPSEAFILLDFKRGIILIGGTHYAGEMKKAIFTTLNYLLPPKGVLTMHCSANVGAQKDVALFFGLSGTGKTTLSADPKRRLIGDDEHGWDEEGVFNLEGGCYAKCIRLSREYEPQIWNAIREGTILENVVINSKTGAVDYNDDLITENTRAAYPLHYIDNAVTPSVGGHPGVIFFLTADAFGVLPPVSKLTPEEAMYHFLSGYTAKLAGTETGVQDPQATFSMCFGAPFLPRSAMYYGKMFREKTARHHVPVYLINTGWMGGPYGVGKRIALPHTRAIIDACINGSLAKVNYKPNRQFHLNIPSECPGIPAEILEPSNTWKDKEAYAAQASKLAALFEQNFSKLKTDGGL